MPRKPNPKRTAKKSTSKSPNTTRKTASKRSKRPTKAIAEIPSHNQQGHWAEDLPRLISLAAVTLIAGLFAFWATQMNISKFAMSDTRMIPPSGGDTYSCTLSQNPGTSGHLRNEWNFNVDVTADNAHSYIVNLTAAGPTTVTAPFGGGDLANTTVTGALGNNYGNYTLSGELVQIDTYTGSGLPLNCGSIAFTYYEQPTLNANTTPASASQPAGQVQQFSTSPATWSYYNWYSKDIAAGGTCPTDDASWVTGATNLNKHNATVFVAPPADTNTIRCVAAYASNTSQANGLWSDASVGQLTLSQSAGSCIGTPSGANACTQAGNMSPTSDTNSTVVASNTDCSIPGTATYCQYYCWNGYGPNGTSTNCIPTETAPKSLVISPAPPVVIATGGERVFVLSGTDLNFNPANPADMPRVDWYSREVASSTNCTAITNWTQSDNYIQDGGSTERYGPPSASDKKICIAAYAANPGTGGWVWGTSVGSSYTTLDPGGTGTPTNLSVTPNTGNQVAGQTFLFDASATGATVYNWFSKGVLGSVNCSSLTQAQYNDVQDNGTTQQGFTAPNITSSVEKLCVMVQASDGANNWTTGVTNNNTSELITSACSNPSTCAPQNVRIDPAGDQVFATTLGAYHTFSVRGSNVVRFDWYDRLIPNDGTPSVNDCPHSYNTTDNKNIQPAAGTTANAYDTERFDAPPSASQARCIGVHASNQMADGGNWSNFVEAIMYIPSTGGTCTGTLPSGSTLCSGDNAGLTSNSPYTEVADASSCSSPAGSAPKCEWYCPAGTVLSADGSVCEPATYEFTLTWQTIACITHPVDSFTNQAMDEGLITVTLTNGGTPVPGALISISGLNTTNSTEHQLHPQGAGATLDGIITDAAGQGTFQTHLRYIDPSSQNVYSFYARIDINADGTSNGDDFRKPDGAPTAKYKINGPSGLCSNGSCDVLVGTLPAASSWPAPAACVGGPVCGNSTIEPPETCDDGNTISGDGCSSTCQTETVTCVPGTCTGTRVCGSTATGWNGCSSCTLPALPVPTINFSANPASIISGANSTLSWTTSQATSASIDQGINTVPVNGAQAVSPTATTTYTLTANNSSCSNTATTTVTVQPASCTQTPSIDSFTQSPTSVPAAGGNSTFSWTTTNVSFVRIRDMGPSTPVVIHDNLNADGSQSVAVTNPPHTYELVGVASDGNCSNPRQSVTITQSSVTPTCGDGNVDPGETCDDGAKVSGDGCSDTCSLEPPTGLACQNIAQTSFDGVWDTHPIADHYEYRLFTGGNQIVSGNEPGTSNLHAFGVPPESPLTVDTEYQFRLYPVNANGDLGEHANVTCSTLPVVNIAHSLTASPTTIDLQSGILTSTLTAQLSPSYPFKAGNNDYSGYTIQFSFDPSDGPPNGTMSNTTAVTNASGAASITITAPASAGADIFNSYEPDLQTNAGPEIISYTNGPASDLTLNLVVPLEARISTPSGEHGTHATNSLQVEIYNSGLATNPTVLSNQTTSDSGILITSIQGESLADGSTVRIAFKTDQHEQRVVSTTVSNNIVNVNLGNPSTYDEIPGNSRQGKKFLPAGDVDGGSSAPDRDNAIDGVDQAAWLLDFQTNYGSSVCTLPAISPITTDLDGNCYVGAEDLSLIIRNINTVGDEPPTP